MSTIIDILLYLINIAWFLVIAQVLISWLIQFEVLNLRQPLVYNIWSTLNRLLEPVYAPIRGVMPNFNGIDLSPMVLLIGLTILQMILGDLRYSLG